MRAFPALALLAAAAAAGQPPSAGDGPGAPRLSVVLAPQEPTIGDRVTATLVLSGLPEGAGEPRFPLWQAEWGDAEVVEVHAPEAAGDGWRQQLTLAFFAPGERRLPEVSVQVPTGEETRTVSLPAPAIVTVRSVLPGDGEAQPEPAEPPRQVPFGAAFAWLASALALACAALGTVLARRRDDAAPAPRRRAAPLDELLDRLSGLDADGDPAGAWERGTLALRRYLGRALRFPAVESTTLQVQRFLSRRLTAELSGRVVRLLRSADQVKFARRPASVADAGGAIEEIASLAGAIEEHRRGAAAGEEAA